MPNIKTTGGLEFFAEAGETLLNAAARAGVVLPHSCSTGRCSACKAKVRSGTTHAIKEELGLLLAEKSEGWVLSCVRCADSDAVLEVEDLGSLSLPIAKTLPCRIQSLESLSSDVVKITLRLPPNTDFEFHAGQYINVIGPGGVRRSYSLANAPRFDKTLELHIRAVPDGVMTRYWFSDAKANDLLRLNGPLGTFFLRKLAGRNLVFLATGTGIAPVKAMLEALHVLAPEQCPESVAVYWGGRELGDLYLDAEPFEKRGHFVPVLSRSTDHWAGARGYVQQCFLNETPDLTKTVVYACGSNAMIQSAKSLLCSAGLPENCFFSDAFVSSGEH